MWFITLIDLVFGVGLFINALLFIPQAIKVYRRKNASGLSIWTFFGFNFIQLLFALHGLIVHDYILFIGMGLSLLTAGSVTLSILFYQKRDRHDTMD